MQQWLWASGIITTFHLTHSTMHCHCTLCVGQKRCTIKPIREYYSDFSNMIKRSQVLYQRNNLWSVHKPLHIASIQVHIVDIPLAFKCRPCTFHNDGMFGVERVLYAHGSAPLIVYILAYYLVHIILKSLKSPSEVVKLKLITHSQSQSYFHTTSKNSQKWRANRDSNGTCCNFQTISFKQIHFLISGQCISYVWGREVSAGFNNHEATVHMAHCCNEGVMFLPLIYPDYTMERESLLMGPCVPPLHLPICLFSSSDFWGTRTVSHTGHTCSSPNSSLARWHIGIRVENQIKELENLLRVILQSKTET